MIKILFVDGTSSYTPSRLSTKPCGGILTSLTKIPRYLASLGMEVYVISTYQKDDFVDGVHYIKDLGSINPDVVVFNRNMINNALVDFYPHAKKVWWLHDIVDHRYLEDDAYRRVDKIISLSDYCTNSFSDFYGIPREKFHKIPNGVDKAIFTTDSRPRNKNLFLMASAPVKGMYPVSFTWHNLKRLNPAAELRLYCSQKLHDLEETTSMSSMIKSLRAEGVSVFQPVRQDQLAELLKEAWAFLMPNHYPEICSNVLLQAQACGCPVVATNIGSANEFISTGTNGLLTHTRPHDMFWWHKDFAENVVRLMVDEDLHAKISRNSPKGVMSWEEVGSEWASLIGEIHGNRHVHEVSERVHV